MNANDRKELSEIISQLEELKERAQNLADNEREKFDNLSEGLQASERGQAIELAADELENGTNAIEDALSCFGNIDT